MEKQNFTPDTDDRPIEPTSVNYTVRASRAHS